MHWRRDLLQQVVQASDGRVHEALHVLANLDAAGHELYLVGELRGIRSGIGPLGWEAHRLSIGGVNHADHLLDGE